MLILDRFDKDLAYISSDDGMLCADRRLISPDVNEGDVLRIQAGLYIRDEKASAARREHIRSLLRNRLKLRT